MSSTTKTETVLYYSAAPFSQKAMSVLKIAKNYVYGEDTIVEFEQVPTPAEGVLCFDLLAGHGIRTLEVWQMETYPNAQAYVAVALKRYKDDELPPLSSLQNVIDIETFSVDERWNMPRRKYFRLGQWMNFAGSAKTTTDRNFFMLKLSEWLEERDSMLIAHNGHDFDFSVLFGNKALNLALDNHLFDTFIHAITNFYAPPVHLSPKGRRMKSTKPAEAKRFYSLETLCFTFGIEGKHGDLNELAKRLECGIGEIPTDDPDFLEYARQDVVALDMLARAMLYVAPMDEVSWREQHIAACNAQITRNGWKVDVEAATLRRDALQARKDELLSRLVRDYNFPTTGVKPWMSKIGKEAILVLLEDAGISRDSLPRTASGAPSLAAEGILEVTEGTEVEGLGTALAELLGQRSLPQLALDCLSNDGKVHPSILPLQRSGRFSVTQPGLTIWGSREGKDDDKAYFIPDSEDEVLIELDYSAADARIVAALSGDVEYAKRFEEGVDSHNLTGEAAFGKEEYYSRMLKNGKPLLRDHAKHGAHLANYGGGAMRLLWTFNKLSAKLGIDVTFTLESAKQFLKSLEAAYPDVTKWKKRAVREAEQTGWITNDWGRQMPVTEGQEHTQAPALYGQGGTRDILCDGLIRMAQRGVLGYIKAHIHDAVVASVPKKRKKEIEATIIECMETTYRGMPFPVASGDGAANWKEAAHG